MNHNERIVAKKTARIIRAARKRRGMTQQAVAGILNTSQANVSKLENGMLIPSALEWFEFCSSVGISPESLRTGYLERKESVLLRSDKEEGGFSLPRVYAENRGSKVRALMPFLSYFNTVFGEDGFDQFSRSRKVDPDLFVDLDNQIGLNFCLDLSRELIQSGKLKARDINKLTRSVRDPAIHGSLHLDYDVSARTARLLNVLIRNSGFYEANFHYDLEEVRAKHLVLSITPEPHLSETAYKADPLLGDFLCRYKRHYFESFTAYAGAERAKVRETECHYQGAKKCVYHFKFAA